MATEVITARILDIWTVSLFQCLFICQFERNVPRSIIVNFADQLEFQSPIVKSLNQVGPLESGSWCENSSTRTEIIKPI